MAFVNHWTASVTIYDTARRTSTVTVYVSETAAEAWINAADQTARDATLIGTFFTAFAVMTMGEIKTQRVCMEREEVNLVAPADAYRGNKAITSYLAANGASVQTSIPAYDPASIPLKPNSVEIDISIGSGAFYNYRQAYIAVAQSNQGSDVQDITNGYVND